MEAYGPRLSHQTKPAQVCPCADGWRCTAHPDEPYPTDAPVQCEACVELDTGRCARSLTASGRMSIVERPSGRKHRHFIRRQLLLVAECHLQIANRRDADERSEFLNPEGKRAGRRWKGGLVVMRPRPRRRNARRDVSIAPVARTLCGASGSCDRAPDHDANHDSGHSEDAFHGCPPIQVIV